MNLVPKVTIGIPLYNQSSNLSAALESVLKQTCRDFTVIISDDCSTDNSYEIAVQFANRDKRIQVIKGEKNKGPILNWYELSKMAGTPYFMWFTADDLLHPSYLEKAIEFHEKNFNAVLVYPLTLFMDANSIVSNVHADSDLNTIGLELEERLLKIANDTTWCSAVYGVFKSKYLPYIPIQERVIGHDQLWLFVSAILGHIIEIPEVLLFRREVRVETDEQRLSRYVRWGIYLPTQYSPFARFAIKHFFAVLKVKKLSFITKVKLIKKLTYIFQKRYKLKKKDIFFQFFHDRILHFII